MSLADAALAAMPLPAAAELARAFGRGDSRRPWILRAALLPAAMRRAIAAELEAGYAAGELGLARGRVDAGGRLVSSRGRADEMRRLDGSEEELARVAPDLLALVRWSRAALAPHLARAWPRGAALATPDSAMLARYPAPSIGYRAHFDNPGGRRDNARALTAILYLNPPESPCRGGELALWGADGHPDHPPGALLAPEDGALALFDARATLHEVRPLAPGPARWSLTLWLTDGEPPAPRER